MCDRVHWKHGAHYTITAADVVYDYLMRSTAPLSDGNGKHVFILTKTNFFLHI